MDFDNAAINHSNTGQRRPKSGKYWKLYRWNNQADGSVHRGSDPQYRFLSRGNHGQQHQSHMVTAMVVEDTLPKQTIEQWEDLTQLIEKFQTIFSQNKYDVGCINLEPQRIHLISDLPISLRPYRNSQQESKEIQTQIEELLKAQVLLDPSIVHMMPL
ncbi:hypothetical protein TNCV_2179241 [Trichonephila clavipes]|uniref:Uncharacterized protein n=1 Tax=Trichonephila clavipes TaxID=2585209 RepID=A0A8X6VUE1_TRICX|nr:hypothetical protein TNCV_2179241 [Trichonephila clavipes]